MYMQPIAIDPPTNAAIGQSSDGRRAATSKKPTTWSLTSDVITHNLIYYHATHSYDTNRQMPTSKARYQWSCDLLIFRLNFSASERRWRAVLSHLIAAGISQQVPKAETAGQHVFVAWLGVQSPICCCHSIDAIFSLISRKYESRCRKQPHQYSANTERLPRIIALITHVYKRERVKCRT